MFLLVTKTQITKQTNSTKAKASTHLIPDIASNSKNVNDTTPSNLWEREMVGNGKERIKYLSWKNIFQVYT